MPRLTVRCLGPLEILLNEAPLEGFSTQKERALLVYLACHAGQDLSREALQTLLWSESDAERAARSLRQALVNLRRLLPAGFLHTSRAVVRFEVGAHLLLDTAQFEQLPHPYLLYRGDFLQGFNLRGVPVWEEWLAAQREQWLTLALLTLEATGAQHTRRAEYAPAVHCYQRALALDPWRETAHQAMMRVYALSGDRAAALAQYQKCCLALQQGLRISPAPESTALYQRILNGEALHLEDVGLSAQQAYQLPFTGRAEAHRDLVAAWEAARQGRAYLTLVEAEAGMGKTRLIEESLRQLQLRGASIIRGRGIELATEMPYRPIIEVLRALLNLFPPGNYSLPGGALAELATLLPELSAQHLHLPPRPTQPSELARQRLFEAILQLFIALRRPIILFIDDLHWADTATFDLLNYLTREFSPARCPLPVGGAPIGGQCIGDRGKGSLWLVGAYRREETSLDHPLTRLRQGLGRDGLAQRISLAPLEEAHVMALAVWLSDDARLGPFLWRESGGTPFVVTEIVRELQESGFLLPAEGGKWRLAGELPVTVLPERVEDLTLQRVGRLPEAVRGPLYFAAVIGERFSLDFLADVLGESAVALQPAAQIWQERQLLRPVGGEIGFTHDKIQQAIYGSLTLDMRKLMHERVGQALSERDNAANDLTVAARIAHHFERGFAPRRAAPYLFQALEIARRMYAYAQALEYAERLLPLTPLAAQAEVWLTMAALRQANLDNLGAIAAYQQAREAAELWQRPDWRARAWCGMASQVHADGDPQAALQMLQQAEQAARAAGDAAVLIEVLYNRGWALHRIGQNEEAMGAVHEALHLGEISTVPEYLTQQSLRLLGSIHIQIGNYLLARQYMERLLAADQRCGNREGAYRSYNTLGEIARLRGDFATAEQAYRMSLAIAQQILPFSAQIARRSNLAGALVGLGEFAQAETELRGLMSLPEVARWPLYGEMLRFLAEAYLGLGRVEEAWHAAQQSLAIAEKSEMADVQAAAWRVLGTIAGRCGVVAVGCPPEVCFAHSLAVGQRYGLRGECAWTLYAWGKVEEEMGDVVGGGQRQGEARALFEQLSMFWPG